MHAILQVKYMNICKVDLYTMHVPQALYNYGISQRKDLGINKLSPYNRMTRKQTYKYPYTVQQQQKLSKQNNVSLSQSCSNRHLSFHPLVQRVPMAFPSA